MPKVHLLSAQPFIYSLRLPTFVPLINVWVYQGELFASMKNMTKSFYKSNKIKGDFISNFIKVTINHFLRFLYKTIGSKLLQ